MPWKERSVMEERMRFLLRLKDGESMASLCREFGISRVTGYKIYERYKQCGLKGLTDRARTPYRYANKLPAEIEAMIVTMRREKPTWGARKLRERLLRKLPNDVRVPACSTIHAILASTPPGWINPARRCKPCLRNALYREDPKAHDDWIVFTEKLR
jgi:transposase